MIVLCIERRGYLEILREKVLMIFDLWMVLMEMIMFLVGMIMLYLRKYLLILLQNWVHLVYKIVLSNMEVIRRCSGGC